MSEREMAAKNRVRVGINGFGRMGRLCARLILERPELGLDLVHVNEKTGDAGMAAYLLQFDSTHGKFGQVCVHEGKDVILVKDASGVTSKIHYTQFITPDAIPWHDSAVTLVLECTGAFLSMVTLQGHLRSGSVKRVVVSAPVEDKDVLNVVVGCNDHLLTASNVVVTAASCTTNCAAPVVGAIDAAFGIEFGSINTVHNVTPTQSIMDVPNPGKKNDYRRARSGAVNLAPTTTGSAKAISMIYPHLQGKLNGLAIRVPCQNASITDMVLVVKRDTTAEEVNTVLNQSAMQKPTILGYEARPLVSTDYVNDSRSSIVDALSTQVVAKRMVKVLAWYDNEWGYANRVIDIAERLAQFIVPKANL